MCRCTAAAAVLARFWMLLAGRRSTAFAHAPMQCIAAHGRARFRDSMHAIVRTFRARADRTLMHVYLNSGVCVQLHSRSCCGGCPWILAKAHVIDTKKGTKRNKQITNAIKLNAAQSSALSAVLVHSIGIP